MYLFQNLGARFSDWSEFVNEHIFLGALGEGANLAPLPGSLPLACLTERVLKSASDQLDLVDYPSAERGGGGITCFNYTRILPSPHALFPCHAHTLGHTRMH